MIIREIEERDNTEVENLIRTCLIETEHYACDVWYIKDL